MWDLQRSVLILKISLLRLPSREKFEPWEFEIKSWEPELDELNEGNLDILILI